tara:strand:+ start:12517 stop:13665 length:1149 start_codon:yes stop_codon:yes gene_type:complete
LDSRKTEYLILGPFFPFRGGISETNHSLYDSLKKLGIKTKKLSFEKLYPKVLFPGKSQYYDKVETNSEDKKIRILHTYNPTKWKNTVQEIISINPRFIIFRYWTPFLSPFYSFVMSNLPKEITKIALVDNWVPHEKNFFDRFLNNLFAKKIDLFITFSKNVALKINKKYFKKVITIFHPINFNLPKIISKKKACQNLKISEKFTYILYFGIIREYKGLDLLINSFAKENIKKKNIKLIIAGEFYSKKEKYLNLINQLKLNSKIILDSKFISNNKVRDYFCVSDLLLQTYRSSSQSGVTSKAYYYETPILVSDINGLKEQIKKDNTGGITKLNYDEISKKIIYCLNKKNKNRFILNIKKNKLKYSWSIFSKKLIESLNKNDYV